MKTKSRRTEGQSRQEREKEEELERKRKQRRAREEEDEQDEQDDDEEEEPKPKKKGKTKEEDVEEAPESVKRRASKRQPKDIEEFKNRKTRKVVLIATRLGFDGTKRIRPGAKFIYAAPLDDKGRVLLPSWAVLEKDYEPEPELELPPGMRPKAPQVRGGSSQGGVKPKL